MTISTDTATASYTGNGTTQIFPVPFYFLVDTDLKVSKKVAATGVVSVLTLNSDYTVSDAGNQAGGSITTLAVPASGDQLFIERNVDAVQETSYPENGIFPAASHEKALDRLTMIAQQILSKLTFGLFRDPLANTFDVGGGRLTNIADAVDAQDVPSLHQVQQLVTDGAVEGLSQPTGATLVGYLTGTVGSFLDSLKQAGASVGAALLGFMQSGTGAVSRTAQDKMRETRISVKDFGAKGDGTTDDTAAFNAAVTYCASRNGGVIFVPAGTYKISSMITVSSNGIVFQGEGFDTSHDTGVQVHQTLIQWAGGTDEAMFLFTSIAGASNKCITGCGVLDIAFNGTNGASLVKNHVEIQSHRHGHFRFFGTGSSDWILKTGCVSALGEAEDTQYNRFEVFGRQFSSGGGGIQLAGSTDNTQGANTSFNQFDMIDLQISTGTGIQFGNTDTNFIEIARITGVTTGMAYEFRASNVADSHRARGNFIRLLSSHGPGYARGTPSGTYPSESNYIGLDVGNGTPIPTIEAGASCYYAQAGRDPFKFAAAKIAVADTLPNAQDARNSMGTETLRIYTSSSSSMILDNGTTQWAVSNNGLDLLLKPVSGTGGGVLRFGSFTSSGDTAVNGYVTIKDANGTTRKLATIA